MGNNIDRKFYAAYLKDREQLLNSASGGMFTALSDVFINKGDAVVCCVYNSISDEPELKLIFTKDERDKARGSKYIQCKTKNVYEESLAFLEKFKEKRIIFFGTGCQAMAFIKFMELKAMSDRIVTVDIICHGVPSSKIWREYIQNLRKQVGGEKVTYISFRDKRTGWKSSVAIARIGEKEFNIQNYKKYLYGPMVLRPSCYTCPFAKTNRKTDITIGDFWGIEKNYSEMMNNDGVSIVIIHTSAGNELFEQVKEKIVWKETEESKSLQDNLVKATVCSPNRRKFMEYYSKKGFEKTFRLYADDTLWGKVKRKLIKLTKY